MKMQNKQNILSPHVAGLSFGILYMTCR